MTAFGGAIFAWFDVGDWSTLWQDSIGGTLAAASGDPVGAIFDKAGNGNHAVQASAPAKPVRNDTGLFTTLVFSGAQSLVTPTFALKAQPTTLVVIGEISGNSQNLVDGVTERSAVGRGASATTATIDNGTTLSATGTPPLSSRRAIIAEFNGSSSRIFVNNQPHATGNAGAVGTTNLRLGGVTGSFLSGRIGELMLITRLITAQERTDLYDNYLNFRWGPLLCR